MQICLRVWGYKYALWIHMCAVALLFACTYRGALCSYVFMSACMCLLPWVSECVCIFVYVCKYTCLLVCTHMCIGCLGFLVTSHIQAVPTHSQWGTILSEQHLRAPTVPVYLSVCWELGMQPLWPDAMTSDSTSSAPGCDVR